MRILYISSSPFIGGAEVGLCGLLRELDRSRFAAIVVCPPGGDLTDALHRIDVEVVNLPLQRFRRTTNVLVLFRYTLHLLFTVIRLRRLIVRQRVHLVHSNETRAHLYGVVAAHLARVPVMWHVRDFIRPRVLEFILSRLSTRIVAVSTAVGASISSASSATDAHAKMLCIHNGMDIDAFRRLAETECSPAVGAQPSSLEHRSIRAQFGIDRDTVLVVMVAQLVPWKGHEIFLQACSEIGKIHDGVRFIVVGGDRFGENTSHVAFLQQECTRLGLNGRVVFSGHRNDAAVIMATADLLVLPSRNEPFGRVLIEMMALGKPVVATNEAGPREIVVDGETGLLVPAGNREALVRTVLRLIDDPTLRASLGEAGLVRVRALFSAHKHVARMESAYESIAQEKGYG